MSWAGRSLLVITKVLLPVVLLVAVAGGIFYVRLLNGPISLSFLSDSIARGISSELPGLSTTIGQSVVELRGSNLEFRLKNVQLNDDDGKAVAIAPLAAVEVSRSALLSGVVSPSRIILIKPRLRVFYNQQSGLALSIAGGQAGNETRSTGAGAAKRDGRLSVRGKATADQNSEPASSAFGHAVRTGQINLARTVAELAARARKRGDATSYLNRIGVQDAIVIIDHDGNRSAWRVPKADFGLVHSGASSVLSGSIAVATAKGLWTVALRAEDFGATERVRLTAGLRDFYPETIAEAVPGLAALSALKLPVSGQLDMSLSSDGEILAANFDAGLGKGPIALPWLETAPPRLDSGRIALRYRRGEKHVTVAPSTIRWSGSDMTVVGTVAQRSVGSSGLAWDFKLRSTSGRLSTGNAGEFVKVKRWEARGSLLPAQGIVNLDQVIAQAGAGAMIMNGTVYTGSAPGMSVAGRFGPMTARNFLGLWPYYIGPAARRWAEENVMAGQLRGGTFSTSFRKPTGAAAAAPSSDYTMKIDAELSDVRFLIDKALPPVFASTARLSLRKDTFKLDVPQSAFVLADDRSLQINELRLTSHDVFNAIVDGRAGFKIKGDVKEALNIAQRLGVVQDTVLKRLSGRVSGRVEGRFDLTIPLARPHSLPQPTVVGQVRILDGRVKKAWRGFDVRGSNIIIDANGDGLVANGQLLVGGVPARISWQRVFEVRESRQPPLRLKATLDAADRKQLGFKVNHILQGPVGVDVTLRPMAPENSPNDARVRVDLTNAELSIDSLTWRKPKGQRAIVDFDVVAGSGKAGKLTNIRLDGEGIAVRGSAEVGADGQLSTFNIPQFSINVVTRLRMKGERRKGNVWRVSVRGPTYEGREFFRTLFSAGKTKSKIVRKGQPGLDLDVRIDNVLGFWDTRLRGLRLDLSKRKGKIIALRATGKLGNNGTLEANVKRGDKRRQLVTTSNDAGRTFKLIGFYPNARGGSLRSSVDLDDRGSRERRGLLAVRKFQILGDEVLSEVLQSGRGGTGTVQRQRRRAVRQVVQFDWMRIPFLIGRGQFIIGDAELRGPLLGVLMCGRADFAARRMRVGGTYVPLQGLNGAIGAIPGIGQLLAGPKGEGVLGITFEIRGAMQRPEVLVNPLSLVAPGIFREMFQVACPKNIIQRAKASAPKDATSIGEGWASPSSSN